MTTCAEAHRKYKKEGNFCGKSRLQFSRELAYLEIVEKIVKVGIEESDVYKRFTPGAARPMISLHDDGTKTEALNYVIARLKDEKSITEKELNEKISEMLDERGCSVPNGTKKPDKVPVVEKKEELSKKKTEERPVNGGEKPHTQPAPGTPNHDKFAPQPGGEPAETDLPAQPSLAAQMKEPVITDNTPIISPKSDNPAAVVARPPGMTPDKFNREEVERTAQEFLTALEKVYPKFKIMTDDVLRYHTSWKVKDLLCYGIEAVSTGKVPQSAMMGKGGP